jgi:hypothetical protein
MLVFSAEADGKATRSREVLEMRSQGRERGGRTHSFQIASGVPAVKLTRTSGPRAKRWP